MSELKGYISQIIGPVVDVHFNLGEDDAAKLPEKLFAWELDGTKCGDSWNKIVIIANPTDEAVPFVVPETGKYHLITDGIEFCKDDKIVPNETSVMVKPKTVVVVAEF